jgi:TolA-binding protein
MSQPQTNQIQMQEIHEQFIQCQDEIAELRKQSREKNKIMKELKKQIYEHMEEHNMDTYTIGQYTIQKNNTSHCNWNEEALSSIIDSEALQQYKEENSETKISYHIKKRKRE